MKNNLYYQDEYVKETFNAKMFGRLIKSAYRHKKQFWGCVFIEIFTSTLALVPSLLYSVIVAAVFPSDGIFPENYMLITGLCIGGLVVTGVGTSIGYYIENILPQRFAQVVCTELRTEIFNHLTELSFHYYDTHTTGKILVRATNYIDQLADMFNGLFYFILYCASVSAIGLVWMFVLDWRLGGAVLIGLIPLVFIMSLLAKAIHNRAGRDHNKNANYTAFVTENINGAEVVRSYNRGKLNGTVAEELFDDYSKAFMHTTRVREAFFPLANGFTEAVITLIVYGVSLAVILTGWGGVLSLGTVVAASSVLSQITNCISMVCEQITNISTLTTNIERIYDTIDTPVDIHDEAGAIPLENCRGEVEFKDVNFCYVEGVPVLKNFTLSAKEGETVALVGATGSGKTTIVNLLSRFYDVQEGSVCVDGKDVRAYTLHSLRENIGAMMQDTFLFNGTVLDNIRFSRPEATDEECKAAAKAAYADAFISRLPEGYETMISEGYALSGGERQLLSFARLILADPKIIVLDEATSHIDTQTELEVQNSLKTLLAGRTSFVIAHRLSTIRGADKIVFIEDGEIAEQGTHSELMALNGQYAKMIKAAAV